MDEAAGRHAGWPPAPTRTVRSSATRAGSLPHGPPPGPRAVSRRRLCVQCVRRRGRPDRLMCKRCQRRLAAGASAGPESPLRRRSRAATALHRRGALRRVRRRAGPDGSEAVRPLSAPGSRRAATLPIAQRGRRGCAVRRCPAPCTAPPGTADVPRPRGRPDSFTVGPRQQNLWVC